MLGVLYLWLWTIAFNPSHAVDPIAMRWIDNVQVVETYDTSLDSSIQKFLDKNHPFDTLNYKPSDLMNIESDFTANNSREFQLRTEASIAFADMAWHFWNHFNWKRRLSINTAYRSYDVQRYLLGSYCVWKSWQCAIPWTSEHQAWLALDLWVNNRSLDTASFLWLQANAHRWWFHNTYQKGIDVDGQIVEPWHWRYIGVELATELYEKGLSFAEWYYGFEK